MSLAEPLQALRSSPFVQEAAALAREAAQDRRAVTGVVAALGAGLLLGVFLKPTIAPASQAAPVAGLTQIEATSADTEGLDIVVTARAAEEGRLPVHTTMLEAPVLGDPGPAPIRRVRYISTITPVEAPVLTPAIAAPELPACGDHCVAALQPARFD
jgi:hypothetical protein